MKWSPAYSAVLASVCIVGGIVLLATRTIQKSAADAALRSQAATVSTFNPRGRGQSLDSLEDIVKENDTSPDVERRKLAARARLALGYGYAHKKEWSRARSTFLETAKKHVDTPLRSADYGSVSGQAQYQAAVCLVATGDRDAARKEFLDLLKNSRDSAIAVLAYRRLLRLNGGETTPEYEKLSEARARAREEARLTALSACGPKVLEYMAAQFRIDKSKHDWLKLCQTTTDGTSMGNLSKAFGTLGFLAIGRSVNRQDFSKLSKPSIWLQDGHYVVLLQASRNAAQVYDPTTEDKKIINLPPMDDPEFRATVLELHYKPKRSA